VAVVLDTSVALAFYSDTDAAHADVAPYLLTLEDDLVTTPLVIAELEQQLPRFGGRAAQEAFWTDLEQGAFTVRWWSTALAETLVLVRERPEVGLADASLLALARLLGTDRIATLDHRHFRPARTVDGRPFTLVP
jgi:predicted nucleic acid-binding protein